MKILAPNEENQTSTEPVENSQESVSSGATDDGGGIDLGDIVEGAIDFVSSFLED